MALIYFVEDNRHILSDGIEWLQHHDFQVAGADSAEQLDHLLAEQIPDLVILDWMLPSEDGLSIAQRLRSSEHTQHIGIIFLTAKSTIDDRIAGLDQADAYLTKPFDYRELLATINAVLRRVSHTQAEQAELWTVFSNKRMIQAPDGRQIPITERENLILQILSNAHNRIISFKELVSALDEDPMQFEKSRLEMSLSRLRTKLATGDGINDNPIRCYRQKGYQLMLNVVIQ